MKVFTTNQVSQFSNFLNLADKSRNNELEVRFSTYTKHDLFGEKQVAQSLEQSPEKYRFLPIIENRVFFKLLETFSKFKFFSEESSVTDYFYDNFIRKSVNHDTNTVSWISKTKSKYFDIWDLNTRLSLSTEVYSNPLDDSIKCKSWRKKKRTSFIDVDVRYDFTIVETIDHLKTPKTLFEIELEYIGNKINMKIDQTEKLNHFLFCAEYILQLLQETQQVLKNSEKHNISLEYAVLTKPKNFTEIRKPIFIGAQPETLHKHHLSKVKKNYSITEKFDGERFILFISDNSQVYFFDRRMRIKKTGLENSKDKGSILDVELVNDTIFVFDIMYYKGNDLRGNEKYNLSERLKLCKSIVENFNKINCIFHVETKKYVFNNFDDFFGKFNLDQKNNDIPRDGIIFTPINEAYPVKQKWQNLLKWKPSNLNSIDFLVEKNNSKKDLWNLFVGSENEENIIFEPFPVMTILDYTHLYLNKNSVNILECVWNYETLEFFPIRSRLDKVKPNFKTIAMDVWQSIQNPVEISDFSGSLFEKMRKHHNRIKKDLVDCSWKIVEQVYKDNPKTEYLDDWSNMESKSETDNNETISVLDLACGRGGDLWKWKAHTSEKNINYIGIDFCKDLLDEAKKRSLEIIKRDGSEFKLNVNFILQDLSKTAVYLDEKFDIVSCQFALHYFYQSESVWNIFADTLTSNIKKNGVFICSLFDGLKVFELVKKGYNKQNVNNNGFLIEPEFDTRLGLDNLKKKEFNISVTAVLNGDSNVILKEPTTEYLVFTDLFIKRMMALGFCLIETKLFSQYINVDFLNNVESLYSQLHRYYIFQYVPDFKSCFKELWKPFHFKYVTIPVKDTDFLFYRECIECLEPFDCMIFNLNLITGRHHAGLKKTDYENCAVLAEHYNIFINVIPVNDAFEPDFKNMILEKPLTYLEDVKMVYFLKSSSHYMLLAYDSEDNDKRSFVFPAPIIVDEYEKSETSENNSKNLDEDIQDENLKSVQEIFTEITDNLNLKKRKTQESEDFSQKLTSDSKPENSNQDLFDDKPINGKGCITIKYLVDYAKERNIKIPSNIKKKLDIIEFLKSKDKK